MNREILFRGKTEQGEWVYGYYLQIKDVPFIYTGQGFTKCSESKFDENGEYVGQEIYTVGMPEKFKVISSTIGQYTNLKDKNGTKIFEGDIVRQNYEITIYRGLWQGDRYEHTDKIETDISGYHVGEVVIIPSKGVCIRNPISHDSIDGTEEKIKRYVNVASYRCEVIGNIHEEVQE